MEYRIPTFEPPRRVVLVGSGSGVSAVDEIGSSRPATGTGIDYTADIRLGGLLRLAQPFLGGAFARVGRKAADGMRRTLAERARAAGATGRGDRDEGRHRRSRRQRPDRRLRAASRARGPAVRARCGRGRPRQDRQR